jgi:hypothetical protein
MYQQGVVQQTAGYQEVVERIPVHTVQYQEVVKRIPVHTVEYQMPV